MKNFIFLSILWYTFLIIILAWLYLPVFMIEEVSKKDTLKFQTTEKNVEARITIKDTYTKNNITYRTFTTDVTEYKEFTLSEAEYDEFIGLNNNVLDCTIWSLSCDTDIYKYQYIRNGENGYFANRGPYAILDIMTDSDITFSEIDKKINERKYSFFSSIYDNRRNESVYIESVDGQDFSKEQYFIKYKSKGKGLYCNGIVKRSFLTERYSFIGDHAFSKEDIAAYKKVITHGDKEMVEACRSLLEKESLSKNQRMGLIISFIVFFISAIFSVGSMIVYKDKDIKFVSIGNIIVIVSFLVMIVIGCPWL